MPHFAILASYFLDAPRHTPPRSPYRVDPRGFYDVKLNFYRGAGVIARQFSRAELRKGRGPGRGRADTRIGEMESAPSPLSARARLRARFTRGARAPRNFSGRLDSAACCRGRHFHRRERRAKVAIATSAHRSDICRQILSLLYAARSRGIDVHCGMRYSGRR